MEQPSRTRRTENVVVNATGLVQGITLVTFPAASSIFTDPSDPTYEDHEHTGVTSFR